MDLLQGPELQPVQHDFSHRFITKKEAQDLGWPGGNLEPYAPGMCIGGSKRVLSGVN